MKERNAKLFLVALAAACLLGSKTAAAGPLEDWAAAIEARDAGMAQVEGFKAELLEEASQVSQLERWRRLVRGEPTAREQAAEALALVEELFPGGDPANWDDVKGFWLPSDVPKPLAAFDAVFFGVEALLSMEDPRAPWTARWLAERLAVSDRARTAAFRMAPGEVRGMLETLAEVAPPPPTGGWPSGVAMGDLPYARAASGWVTEGRATVEGMTFLDASGVPKGGTGPYAWDRKRGRLYRVVFDEDRIWIYDD